jgi:Uma2 family endonuclease
MTTLAAPAEVPLLLPPELRLSPEQFALVCQANPNAVLELNASGELISMTPTGGDTSARNSALIYALEAYARRTGRWKAFDSSGGFRLSDGSVLSPDASLVRLERWQALNPEQRRSFPPLCPDLVVELASPSDEGPRGISALRQKMSSYIRNGAQLGWLLLPSERAVEIWRSGSPASEAERRAPASQLAGEPLLPGFCLALDEIWEA